MSISCYYSASLESSQFGLQLLMRLPCHTWVLQRGVMATHSNGFMGSIFFSLGRVFVEIQTVAKLYGWGMRAGMLHLKCVNRFLILLSSVTQRNQCCMELETLAPLCLVHWHMVTRKPCRAGVFRLFLRKVSVQVPDV